MAGFDVKKRQAEENYREQQHRHILHRNSMGRTPLNSCVSAAFRRHHPEPCERPDSFSAMFDLSIERLS
jgi:hypothetical protein